MLLKNIKYLSKYNKESVSCNDNSNPTWLEINSIADKNNISAISLMTSDLSSINKRAKNIKFIVLDVDGVMSDGGMYFTENGDQIKKFNTKDGMGIMRIQKQGIKVGIISSGFTHNMVQDRAKLLGIEYCFVGRGKKMEVLSKWLEELNYTMENVAFIGDDINDAEVMEKAAISACPSDAIPQIKEIADISLSKEGGRGCVREFIDRYFDIY
jgi:3-deoxy-D-manno-octulosonate 8-phosphate phosphatase (KDO 8-P phosphatase)